MADGPYAPHVVTADKTDGERAESEKGASLKFRKSLIPPSTAFRGAFGMEPDGSA